MVVYIKLLPPFSDAVGKRKIEMNTNNNEFNIETLFIELIRQYPSVRTLFPKKLNKNNIYGNCFPVREGNLLRIDDEIKDKDSITIYGSISGG